MLKVWILLLLCMENWEYLDWSSLINILSAGVFIASVITRFLCHLIPCLHITMNFMLTTWDQHNIFIFILLRPAWVKLGSDIEEPWYGTKMISKGVILIPRNAFLSHFLRKLSWTLSTWCWLVFANLILSITFVIGVWKLATQCAALVCAI